MGPDLELVLERHCDKFYVLLTVYPCIILYIKPTSCTTFFLVCLLKGVTGKLVSNTLLFVTYAVVILNYPRVPEVPSVA